MARTLHLIDDVSRALANITNSDATTAVSFAADRYWGTDPGNPGDAVAGQSWVYDYDPIGNRITAAEGDTSRSASYTANALNQYGQRTVPGYAGVRGEADTNATVTVNADPAWRWGGYFYGGDAADNSADAVMKELEITATYSNLFTSVTGRVFVAETPEAFTYDDDGNLTQDGRFDYTWNGENRLIKAETRDDLPAAVPRVKVEYAYDHQGRMVWKQISTNAVALSTRTLLWDGYNIVRSLTHSPTHTLTNAYVWGLDLSGSLQGAGGVGGLLTEVQNDVPYVAAFDANGNVTEYISTDGTIAAHYEYSPFGEIVIQSGDLADSFTHRFSTKPWCAVTGLSEYEFRKYSPSTGRWLSRDPIGESGGQNLYTCVGNRLGDQYDLLGWSWPTALAKCGLEALKKVLGDKLGQEIKGARLCEKVADHIFANVFADPCERQSFDLEKPPLTFDVNNWAQVALSCVLGQVRSAGGIDKFLETIDDDSKRKLLEKLVDLGEEKLSDLLESKSATMSYSISYQCDSQKSVGFDLVSHLSITVDGEEVEIPFSAGEQTEKWRCSRNLFVGYSRAFSSFCCGCETLLARPPNKE